MCFEDEAPKDLGARLEDRAPSGGTCIRVCGLHSGQQRPGLRVFEHGDGVRVGGELGGVVIHVF